MAAACAGRSERSVRRLRQRLCARDRRRTPRAIRGYRARVAWPQGGVVTKDHARDLLARVRISSLKSDAEIADVADTLLPFSDAGSGDRGATKREIVELLRS